MDELRDEIASVVLVHFDEGGAISYQVCGDSTRLFIVDERAPNDRVYEWTPRAGPEVIREIIPEGSELGSSQDSRHPALKHRIEAALSGRTHLAPVPHGEV